MAGRRDPVFVVGGGGGPAAAREEREPHPPADRGGGDHRADRDRGPPVAAPVPPGGSPLEAAQGRAARGRALRPTPDLRPLAHRLVPRFSLPRAAATSNDPARSRTPPRAPFPRGAPAPARGA